MPTATALLMFNSTVVVERIQQRFDTESNIATVVVYFDQHQTLVEIVIFSIFCAKKLKKQKICSKIFEKTRFLSLHQNAG